MINRLTNERRDLAESHLFVACQVCERWERRFPRLAEDIYSEACWGLVQAASRYDLSGRVPFASFAFCRSDGAVRDWLARETCGKVARQGRACDPRILAWLEYSGGRLMFCRAEQLAEEALAIREILRDLAAGVDARRSKILKVFMEEGTVSRAARSLDISKARVSVVVQEATSKLRGRYGGG